MVSLFWIEWRISDRLLILLNGISRPTPVPYIAPSEQRQVKRIANVSIFPMDKGGSDMYIHEIGTFVQSFSFFCSYRNDSILRKP